MPDHPIPPPPRPNALLQLAPDWLQWVAENRLWNSSPESMLAAMVAAGQDEALSAAAISQIEQDPVFQAARRHQQMLRKLESVVSNMQKVWESDPGYRVIEKRRGVSREELLERYVKGCRPVVLQDVAEDWPAMRRWSPQDLSERFGQLEVDVQLGRNSDALFEQNKASLRKRMRVAEFVERVVQGGETNDHYLTANDEMLRRPEFLPLLADIGRMPPLCDPALLPTAASLWFGPGGTHTPLHHDKLMLFHTQVLGRKRWRFISPLQTPLLYNRMGVFSPINLDAPDYERYPLLRRATVLETVLEPGDTLFLPLGWWHQVSSLELSMSFSYTNLDVPNEFDYQNPTIGNW
ncbi:cupin-like domain-containing protein [Pelomonas sp. KK5]|uniref:cupin-like domain-containing protein n=1 Tax=Pelomonas sp. KK5 TaxID=1855730 RepID=UPI001301B143|nr:cupin-like domain-containing protein [Pelomonas sp. KK5]